MARQVAPENVVGRKQLIARIWKTLRRKSVVFTAERRIGKTTVMKKMEREAPDNFSVVYMDLEKVGLPVRFLEVLLLEVRKLVPTNNSVLIRFRGLMDSIGGLEIGGIIKIPKSNHSNWQEILEKTFLTICSEENETIVFFFDELPYMLQKIAVHDNSSSKTALAILDTLRAMRNEHPNLRMVFTGSVGLHHVISELRGRAYASQPTNDMESIEIGPLDPVDGISLATSLLLEENIPCESTEVIAANIARQTDFVPFYIERIVTSLSCSSVAITPESVSKEVLAHLTDDKDPWEMDHFRTRIDIYYDGDSDDGGGKAIPNARIVKEILNFLSLQDSPQSIDQVCSGIKLATQLENRDLVIELLRSMSKDHYVVCNSRKQYSFRFPLIKHWWKLAQGLVR